MSDVARVASRDVAVFKPGEAKANDAKADAVIDFAKKVKDVNPHQRVGQGDGGEEREQEGQAEHGEECSRAGMALVR